MEILGHAKLRARAIILWSKGMNTHEIAHALDCPEPPVANYLASAFDEAHRKGWSRERLYSLASGINWALSHREETSNIPDAPRIALGDAVEGNEA